MFACACALFAFVSNAEAQAPDGTYVTITNKETTYYLAVTGSNNNYSITATTTYSDNCVWIQTANNAFWSVKAEQYLTISTSDPYSLILQDDPRPFTNNKGKLSFSQKSGNTTYYYYITFATNTFKGNRARNNANGATTLSITTVNYNPYHKLTLVSPTQEYVTVDLIKTITLSADAAIKSVNINSITLDNATIDEITFDNTQLVITTKAPYADGECTLSISKGAVVGTDGVNFDYFEKSWKISPYAFTSVTPEEGNAGSFSVITLTADVAIKQVPTSGFTLDVTKTIDVSFNKVLLVYFSSVYRQPNVCCIR